MPHAVIQGELHTSRQDKAALIQRMDDVDAVLRESMKQAFERRRDPFYLLLFIGMKLYRNTIQRFLYATHTSVFDLAAENDVAAHRLDIAVEDWNTRIGDGKKGFILGFSGSIAYGTVVDVRPVWLQAVSGVIAFIFLFFLYAALLSIPARDALMVDRITELADSHDYDMVLISVGDAHVDGIADRLREKGWTVETHTSTTLSGRIMRPFMKLVKKF